MFQNICLPLAIAVVFSLGHAIKLDLDNSEYIKEVTILENLFANNHEDIQKYLDLSDYRPNRTFVDISGEQQIDPAIFRDEILGVAGKINRHGYPIEIHTVQTEDGYLLELHRIPSSVKSAEADKRQPVFLMHGLLDSSSAWVLMGAENGLAYLLADAGYDVWMGNARGNRYSRRHITLNPDGNRRNRQRFWDFSWHEIGTIDLPTMIDFVLETTGFQKLHYIGHSQGSTSFFVMASERPEYNEKIILMQALAPVAIMRNLHSPIARALAQMLDRVEIAVNLLGRFEFLPGDDILTSNAQAACQNQGMQTYVCRNILFLTGGFNPELLDERQIPLILRFTPSGASARQIIHYGQLMRVDSFRQYDFGLLENRRRYGQFRPPHYNLANITAPVALHYGLNDWLSAVVDVQVLAGRLPNVVEFREAPHPRFNHFDFVWARNIRDLVYNRVLHLMINKDSVSNEEA